MDKERKIIIDNRENKLINLLKNKIDFTSQNLNVGDIIFMIDNKVELIIERKTFPDIYASLIDGRLHDQKKRIIENVESKNQILYLFEGDFTQRLLAKKKNIYGSILNTIFISNIPTFRTLNIDNTVDFICDLSHRFLNNLSPFNKIKKYNPITLGNFKKKSDTLDPKTCFYRQLCQIPNISNVKANIITENYENLTEFMKTLNNLENSTEYLENLKNKNGKKLGKKSAKNLLFFLGHNS